MTAERIVESELARLGQHQNSNASDLLAATRHMKDRVRLDRHAPAYVGQSVAGFMHGRSRLDDGDRQPRSAGTHLAPDIFVDPRRAPGIEADCLPRGRDEVPDFSEQGHVQLVG